MSEETKSEKKWAYGDAVYMRAMVVSVGVGGRVLVGVRTDGDPSWTVPGFVDIIAEQGALIDPDVLAAEAAGSVARERDEARADLEAIRFILNGDAEGLTARDAVHQFTGVAARVASDLAARTAERDTLCAELTTTRDDLQRTAAAMWEPLRGVAAALGYHRASAPDFGEVDEVAVRELAETTRYLRRSSGLSIESLERDCCEARVAALRAQYERDELHQRLAALEGQLNSRTNERDRAERRLTIAERVIGRTAIDRAMEVE